MKYVLLLIFCALVFLVCFLVDKLLQKLFPKPELKVEAAQPMPPQMMLKMNTNTASPT